MMYYNIRAAACFSLLAAGMALAGDEKRTAQPGEAIDLGMPQNLFQGVPKNLRQFGAEPFLKLMKEQTGAEGKLVVLPDAMMLAQQLNEGKLQLGVFQGQEFAWAQAKYPDLTPILLTTPQEPVQSFCLVRWDSKATNLGDLKGEKIALPSLQHDCAVLFLARQKAQYLRDKDFSGKIEEADPTAAIFDVIDRKAAATIVDRAALENFEATYPGPFKNLKILSKSEVFPNPCLVVKKNALNARTIGKLRAALFGIQSQPEGEGLLTMWRLKSFNDVPGDYEKELKKIRESYPAPAGSQPVSR